MSSEPKLSTLPLVALHELSLTNVGGCLPFSLLLFTSCQDEASKDSAQYAALFRSVEKGRRSFTADPSYAIASSPAVPL